MTLNHPDTGLVEEFSLYRRVRPSVTLAVKRNVVSPVLFRNSNDDRAETQEFGGTLHAQVNGEKFVAKERLTGLSLLRMLDERFGDEGDAGWTNDTDEVPPGLISPDYTYNEPAGLAASTNMDVLTYGIAGTGDNKFGIKSHVIEGYTYSTDEYDVVNREVHNAVFESGTMQTEKGEQSQFLFDYAKVKPGNSFVHFITLEAGTPAMLLYVLHNLLNTTDYGARETRAGKTLQNEVLAVICASQGTTLSTGELLMDYRTDGDIEADLADYITSSRRADWEIYSDVLDGDDFEPLPDWFNEMKPVADRRADDADEQLYDVFRGLTAEAFETLHFEE